jgi:hypothetical protein
MEDNATTKAPIKTTAPPRLYTWIGPVFSTSVSLDGIGEVKPQVLTDKDIEQIIKDYPQLARYWKMGS